LHCQSQLPDRGDLKEQSGSDCTPSHAFCGIARDHKVNNLHMTSFGCRHWWMLWRTGPLWLCSHVEPLQYTGTHETATLEGCGTASG
jgi:hypothetical protein